MTTNSDLRERAERIAKLEEIATEAKADVKAAYDAARSAGHTPSALRKAIENHTLDDSKQMDLEMYLAEIEGRNVMREAAE